MAVGTQRPGSPTLSSSSSTALINTASTALRRLNFKSASAYRTKGGKAQGLPKVVVMGSSSVSIESVTNNTSTDSSNTVVTMVTVTDGDSSLDNPYEDNGVLRITPNILEDMLNETPLSSLEREENDEFYSASSTEEKDTNTRKTSSESRKLLFTPQQASVDEEDMSAPGLQHTKVPTPEKKGLIIEESRIPVAKDPDTSLEWHNIKMRQVNLENISKNTNIRFTRKLKNVSKRYAKNNFEEERMKTGRGSSGFAAEQMTVDSEDAFELHSSPPAPTSPTGSPPKETSKNVTSPAKTIKHFSFSPTVEIKNFPDAVNGNAHPQLLHMDEGRSAPENDIELRDNMSIFSAASNRRMKNLERKWSMTTSDVILEQPDNNNKEVLETKTASIFIQQPSVTGNSPETQPGSQFAEKPTGDGPRRREENMKLLDVVNNMNQSQIPELDWRCGGSHHSRSQSVKTPGRSGGGQGPRPNYLCLPQQRTRVASMPNTGVEEEYYRLRQFTVTGNRVVNRGDSLKSRRSRSNNSVASSNSSHSTEHITTVGTGCAVVGGSYPGSARTSATTSQASSRESSCASCPGIMAPFRVVMLGASAVGKSSLISQFMTSEYLHAQDTSIDDEWNEKSVSVMLDGEESELIFIDHPASEVSPEECVSTYEAPHAYCVVYSTADSHSFKRAEECLQILWKTSYIKSKAVILVANKTDLVRSRVVSTEDGKAMAIAFDCKFIETSVGINHNVDELLVGILSQIRLKLNNPPDSGNKEQFSFRRRSRSPISSGCSGGFRKYRGARVSASLKVKGLLSKVWMRDSKSKSCENLRVL